MRAVAHMLAGMTVFVTLLHAFPLPAHAQEVREARISYGVRPDDFDRTQDPVDVQVRLREPISPSYPDSALRAKIEGIAVIAAAIDDNGVLTYAEVRRSSGHPSLDSAALAAVRGGDFVAAQRDGRRVPSRITIPVEFRISRENYDVEKSTDEIRREARELEKAKRMLEEEQRKTDEELRRLRESQKQKK